MTLSPLEGMQLWTRKCLNLECKLIHHLIDLETRKIPAQTGSLYLKPILGSKGVKNILQIILTNKLRLMSFVLRKLFDR